MAKSVREKVDELVLETMSYQEDLIPESLKLNINNWQWGRYGWISPASLIFTAAWRKVFYPDQDCCKIWARDEQNQPIPGSYSIRSEDENISIPILAKHDLCADFCSANSGMQGSRAIEKMRSFKRLNTDFDASQRTVFDLGLFATILNQINDLNQEQALEVLRFLIVIAKKIRTNRLSKLEALETTNSNRIDILAFLSRTADPELTKCVTAACFEVIFGPHNCAVLGADDYKTAADTRAQKLGDLSINYKDEAKIAVEVKDKTQSIDWNNIEAAKRILTTNTSINNFIFIIEKREATASHIVRDMLLDQRFNELPYNKISIISLHDLFLLASAVTNNEVLSQKVSNYIALVPAIKPETIDSWLEEISKNS